MSRRVRWVIVQKSSRIVSADRRPLIALTITEMLPASVAKLAKKRAVSMKIGLPGG